MKPLFQPFFKPFFGAALPTRLGQIIGKSNERKMMDKAGGPNGISKTFRRNPDGSTTMLKTRAGMPQFSTTRSTGNIPVDNAFAVVFGDSYITNTITIPGGGTYTLSYIDGEGAAGFYWGNLLDYGMLSNGVTVASGPTYSGTPSTTTTYTVTVPDGVTSFTASLDISGGAFYDYNSPSSYTLTVAGNGRSGSGAGTVVGWCTVNQRNPGDPGYVEYASRCI